MSHHRGAPRPVRGVLWGVALFSALLIPRPRPGGLPPAFLRYDPGSPTLIDLWIDPVNGDDTNSGADRAHALRTVTAAWRRIPAGVPLTSSGYRIMLTAGDYPGDTFPLYWESRLGTFTAPVIVQSADGPRAARLQGYVNIYDTRYLYFLDVAIQNGGDVLHCERCDHLLLRGCLLDGGQRQAHETLKINQSTHVYIEDCEIRSAWENAIDGVAVQYGHVVGNRIHSADDWCIYFKGGSAYLRIEANEIFDCGTGGFTAGQGTGFEFMVSPWLHYEAYDIKFVNNLIHHTDGAGMGVNGGYNILFAHNTLYRVGRRSHVIEVALGGRGCDGDASRCAAHLAEGGWGPAQVGGDEPIPNRNIFIYNNIVYNPEDWTSRWQHFFISPPLTASPASHIPSPAHSDTNLQIRGNVIWNGAADHPLGIEGGEEGCPPANPTCNETQLRAENAINSLLPQLQDAAGGNYRPSPDGNLLQATTFAIPPFSWQDAPFPPLVPVGALPNRIPFDRDGHPRPTPGLAGAYERPAAAPPGVRWPRRAIPPSRGGSR